MLHLQKHIVYGPVRSRRLGRSLGINLLPTDLKVCSFNCLYCQYGWTDTHSLNGRRFPEDSQVREAVETALAKESRPPAYITFSGNGEATLHPGFPDIVEGVNRIRDRLAPGAKTAILSNASTVHRPETRRALSRLDVRIMKLDAGDPATLRSYNQPAPGISLEDIQEGLERLDGVTIQTLFTAGPDGNATPKNIRGWIHRLKRITPLMVQIYTLDRGHPSDRIHKCRHGQLMEIKKRLNENNIHADVFT